MIDLNENTTNDYLESTFDLEKDKALIQFKANVKWWESKRWIYNIVVGLCGVSVIGMFNFTNYFLDIIGVILWGLIANLFYSLGILLELWDWFYLNNKHKLTRFRAFFWIIGLLISCFITIMVAVLSSMLYSN